MTGSKLGTIGPVKTFATLHRMMRMLRFVRGGVYRAKKNDWKDYNWHERKLQSQVMSKLSRISLSQNTAKSSPKYPSNNTLSIMSSSPLCCHSSAMSHCHVLTLSTVIVRCPPAVSFSLFFSCCPSQFVLLPLSSLCALYAS